MSPQMKTLVILPSDPSLRPLGVDSSVATATVSIAYDRPVAVDGRDIPRAAIIDEAVDADGVRVDVVCSDDPAITLGQGFGVVVEITATPVAGMHGQPVTMRRLVSITSDSPDVVRLGDLPDAAALTPAQIVDVESLLGDARQAITDAAEAKTRSLTAEQLAADAASKATQAVASQDSATAQNVQVGPLTKAALESRYAAADRFGVDAVRAGVIADGATDTTSQLASAAASAVAFGVPLLLPAGTLMVGAWTPPSGLVLQGGAGTTIKMHPSYAGANQVTINLAGRQNVSFRDVTIDGNLGAFSSVNTEWKHGINAVNCSGITFSNVTVTSCKGDGVYFGKGGADNHASDVKAVACRFVKNYRNNVTIADLTDAEFTACDFNLAAGTTPQAGVDIEPNNDGLVYIVADVRFVACRFNGNAGPGLATTMYDAANQGRVRFVGCTFKGNGQQGVYLYGAKAMSFTDCDSLSNTLQGVMLQAGTFTDLTWTGGAIRSNGSHGFSGQAKVQTPPGSAATGPVNPTIKNLKIIGANIKDNSRTTPGSAYGIMLDLEQPVAGAIDGVTIIGTTVSGTSHKYGVYFGTSVSNATYDGNDWRGNASVGVFNDDATTRARGSNLGIATVAGASTSQTLAANIHLVSVSPAANMTLTLPAAPEPGTEYLLYDATGQAGSNPVSIVPNAGHSFASGGSLSLNAAGQAIKLYYRSNKWFVLSK